MDSWVHDELATLKLGDKRMDKRVKLMVKRMADKPDSSIPQTFSGWAEAKGAYRALSSDKVSPQAIRQAQCDATVKRLRAEAIVLALQDTTSLDFSGHAAMSGCGPLGGGDGTKGYGCFVHSVLAVSADGIPLGLLYQQDWERDRDGVGIARDRKQRPLEEKESFRWIESLRAVHELKPQDTTLITVADREADIFELFAEPRPQGSHLLIRASHNRRLSQAEQCLMDAVAAAPVAGEYEVMIRQHPEHKLRQAHLCVRFRQVTLRPPQNGVHDPNLEPVTLNAISVTEPSPPEGTEPVDWFLLTTLPVLELEDAQECVRYYTRRWLIERYHYVLKSGCKIEDSQLRDIKRLKRLLALYCMVAWRLLWLTYAARRDGDAPCTVALDELEWKTLYQLYRPNEPFPDRPPCLRDTVRWLARLGGFLARTGDGEPGVKVLWRGITRLQDIIIGRQLPAIQDLGKA